MLLPPHLKKYRTAIFDCDGVILDSNRLKSEAFAQTLAGEDPELIRQFVEYHQANGGISRYVKFLHFFKEMKKEKDFTKKTDAALETYGKFCRKGLVECAEIAGIRKILNLFKNEGISCFVVSGGDEKEINEVFGERGLSPYFQKILGSPTTKLENLIKLKTLNLLSSPGIYFGDARSDWEAAQTINFDFTFVAGRSEWKEGSFFCSEKGIPVIQDFLWNLS